MIENKFVVVAEGVPFTLEELSELVCGAEGAGAPDDAMVHMFLSPSSRSLTISWPKKKDGPAW